jgi:hypothetical protein
MNKKKVIYYIDYLKKLDAFKTNVDAGFSLVYNLKSGQQFIL